MTVNDIITIIQSVGFPVVMCGALFWYMISQVKEHAAESKEMREAISALNVAITKLTDKLESTQSDSNNSKEVLADE
nr:MAG TPA: YvrJ protein family protein [Caudoviricetes sp.]